VSAATTVIFFFGRASGDGCVMPESPPPRRARLAGLPQGVIDRAKTILARLEGDDSSISLPSPEARPKKKITVVPADTGQLDLL